MMSTLGAARRFVRPDPLRLPVWKTDRCVACVAEKGSGVRSRRRLPADRVDGGQAARSPCLCCERPAGRTTMDQDLDAYARELLDAHRFVVLGTADGTGLPWVCPVFYALDGPGTLYWVSRPGARHSANVAVRPEVSLV